MRDAKGRFVKGTSGNPKGRPSKEREEKYYNLAMNTVTFADWQRIIARAVKDAIRGDASARKWLSDYLAPQGKHLDITSDGDALKIIIEYADDNPDTT